MKLPVTVKVALLTLVSTLFYTYVGQLVPQKEVQPPEVVELSDDLTTDDLVEIGQEIFNGKGMCVTCHTIGKSGALRFPDLDGIATRAANEISGMSSLEYLAQSLYEPDVYIVAGFSPGMPQIDKPPVALTDEEIRTILAYLQSLGGTPTIDLTTPIPFSSSGPAVASGGEAVAPAGEPTDLLTSFGCADCHSTDGSEGPASTLAGASDRLSGDAIRAWVSSHAEAPDAEATLVESGYYDSVTLGQVQAMTELIAGLGGAS